MRNRIYALIIIALLLPLAQAGTASAQTLKPGGEWSAVQALSPGEKIAVRTKDGDRLTGRFDSATDAAINFTHDGKKVTLTRDSIRNVKTSRGKNRLSGALVGAAVGGGVGAGAGGFVVARSDHFGGTPLPVGIAVGAGVGAAIGAAVGLGTNYETIYEAP